MSVGELLARIAARLDAAGIPYMVVGSFASTFHGVPRSTHEELVRTLPALAAGLVVTYRSAVHRLIRVLVALAFVACAPAGRPARPPAAAHMPDEADGTARTAASRDGVAVAAIEGVLARFERAIVARDEPAMLALMLSPSVPFQARRVDNGKVHVSTAADFAHDIGTAATSWKEEFMDVTILPGDGLATLDAGYRFLEGGRVTNQGREVWTLIETADGWKISSVSWSIILD